MWGVLLQKPPPPPPPSDGTNTGAQRSRFRLVMEWAPHTFTERWFEGEEAAREAARRVWCSWVLFDAASASPSDLGEIAWGGIGIGHASIRKHANRAPAIAVAQIVSSEGEHDDGEKGAAQPHELLRQKAERVHDPALAQPLRAAVDRLEAASVHTRARELYVDTDPLLTMAAPQHADVLGAGAAGADAVLGSGAPASAGESDASCNWHSTLRDELREALSLPEADSAAAALVGVLQRASAAQASAEGGAEGGADDLIALLTTLLEVAPPSDAEMARLRCLSDAHELGQEGYAVATVWLAALFVRTERCIAARSRLTDTVITMGAAQRAELGRTGSQLVSDELPSLLALLGEISTALRRIESEISLQEVCAALMVRTHLQPHEAPPPPPPRLTRSILPPARVCRRACAPRRESARRCRSWAPPWSSRHCCRWAWACLQEALGSVPPPRPAMPLGSICSAIP